MSGLVCVLWLPVQVSSVEAITREPVSASLCASPLPSLPGEGHGATPQPFLSVGSSLPLHAYECAHMTFHICQKPSENLAFDI